ncbi:MAG: DUF362 domain-containing protein, partial [Desulfovibrionaceae bacterium]|nr:DUF362 domain-containing protein [Desulfovibrionaceae bacterium]
MDKEKIPVALLKVEKSCPHDLQNQVDKLWEAAQLKVPDGAKVLVKPNLLRLNPLACSEPDLIVQVCKRLLDEHAKVYVADSPGFGVAEYIAEKLGITPKLKPLGLTVKSFKEYQKITLDLENKEAKLPVAREALEADLIFSIPRIKAHSQMLLTLAVKNCFGVVGGLNKALAHTRYGTRREEFANLLASLFLRLPKVIALVDGRVAMHVSGPSGGKPYHLKLLGAANDAPLMDEVIAQILGLDPK